MNTWLKVNLGDAMLATGMLADLESHLARVYEEEGRPSTMLAVYRHESSDLQCDGVFKRRFSACKLARQRYTLCDARYVRLWIFGG